MSGHGQEGETLFFQLSRRMRLPFCVGDILRRALAFAHAGGSTAKQTFLWAIGPD